MDDASTATALPRWTSVDPLAGKYPGISPYAYCAGNPINVVDPDGRDGVLVIFPDYTITVQDKHYNYLGHAGVLLIDPDSGFTRYFEYGRYDSENKGEVRTYPIPNVVIDENGLPTPESLNRVLRMVSEISGQNGRIEGAYIKSRRFKAMLEYAENREKENSDPKRFPYSIVFNNCVSFASQVLDQDVKVQFLSPILRVPIPNIRIRQYQLFHKRISYSPSQKKDRR